MTAETPIWQKNLRLSEIDRGVMTLKLEPDAETRAALARQLRLTSLPALSANLTLKSWMDGAEINGRFHAVVEQICGVTLEPFEQPLDGEIHVRVLPPTSPHKGEEAVGELELDPEAPDPPDVLEGDIVDVAAYVIEHLALEIDPFPRKPDAVFDYAPPETEESPFAALKALRDRDT